jgi:phosphofructokinase-like protein
MRIGLLTGGGDCPGLNAVIRAVVRQGVGAHGDEFLGFRDGWRGVLDDDAQPLDLDAVADLLTRGGTILGSSRTNPAKRADAAELIAATMTRRSLDGLVAIGGEDTLGAAHRLWESSGLPVVGVPKTIDNDLGATDQTFGFDTALQIATDAIDRLQTTAASHHRVLIAEVMGRHAGWIALHSGIAGGADVILIPEVPFDIDEVCEVIVDRRQRGLRHSIVVTAEGALPLEGTMSLATGDVDEFGHPRLGGVGQALEREIARRTGHESRATVLGHVQRGGTPTAFDRVLATRFGLAAVEAVHAERWGTMAALRGTEIELVALGDAVASLRVVSRAEYERCRLLCG